MTYHLLLLGTGNFLFYKLLYVQVRVFNVQIKGQKRWKCGQVWAIVSHCLIKTSQMVTVWMVERMLWWTPLCDSSLHLQPLCFLWSLPMGVWELGVGNESSWAIMNVLIQVCFDEIPPEWSQITEQNSESLLTTVMKATLAGNVMESIERLQWSLQDTLLCFFPLLLPFFPTSSVINEYDEI